MTFRSSAQLAPSSLLVACYIPVSCFDCSSTLKMEVVFSSETYVGCHRATRRYIPEGGTLQLICYFRE
jgi:hypothetical protein